MIKFNKENIKKYLARGTSLALAITMIGSLAGCKKKSLLEGTLLESSIVATIDGEYEIIKEVHPEYCFNLDGVTGPTNKHLNQDHDHYYSVASGEYLTTDPKCDLIKWGVSSQGEHSPRYIENLDVKGYVIHFLTDEELKLAKDDKLTEDDIIEIISRITAQQVETDDNAITYGK